MKIFCQAQSGVFESPTLVSESKHPDLPNAEVAGSMPTFFLYMYLMSGKQFNVTSKLTTTDAKTRENFKEEENEGGQRQKNYLQTTLLASM